MTLPLWAGRYVGVPFHERGLTLAGLHCWGLVRLVYQQEAGIELPPYAELSAADIAEVTDKIGAESKCGPWLPVTGPRQVFDVVVLRGEPLHVGVMLSERRMLHVERATASCHVDVKDLRIRHCILGTFRHSEIAARS